MKRTIISTIMGFAAMMAMAQTPWDNVLSSVLENNAELRGNIAREMASVAQNRAENALEGLEVGGERMWSADPAKKDKWAVSVSQSFDYPGIYRARKQANDFNTQAFDYLQLSLISDKALSVKLLIIDIINAQARLDFYKQVGENLQRMDSLTQRSFELGNVTILDVRKMQLAVLDNDSRISTCESDVAVLMASLRGLGGVFSESDAMWQSYPIQCLLEPSRNPENYYEYHIGSFRSQAAQAATEAIKLGAMPSFALGYRHAFEDGTHFNGLSVAVKLPSFSQKQRRNAAKLEAEALTAEFDGQLALTMAEAVGNYNSAMSLKASLEQYRNLSGDSSYLELLKRAYDGGAMTIIDYLNEINIFSDARLNYIDLEYRYNLTLARLNRYRAIEFN